MQGALFVFLSLDYLSYLSIHYSANFTIRVCGPTHSRGVCTQSPNTTFGLRFSSLPGFLAGDRLVVLAESLLL